MAAAVTMLPGHGSQGSQCSFGVPDPAADAATDKGGVALEDHGGCNLAQSPVFGAGGTLTTSAGLMKTCANSIIRGTLRTGLTDCKLDDAVSFASRSAPVALPRQSPWLAKT